MSWRIVVIESQSKLDYKMGYLVVRSLDTKRILLDEVAILMIENPAVSLTGILIEELTIRKVKVIFCDSKRSPIAELIPHHGSHDSSAKVRTQIMWEQTTKDNIWRDIVSEKIRKQADFLRETGYEEQAILLSGYTGQIELADATNREGHAAKVYFNALFGKSFSREQDNAINAALNYGYAILLSAVNREILSLGYITQLGLNHCNQFNPYNLGSDLMEPLRGFVDAVVIKSIPTEFNRDVKLSLIELLSEDVKINDTIQTFSAAIRIYCKSVFDALRNQDASEIRFIEYEL